MTQGTLILGECLETLSRMSASSVDMVLADLPYGTTANRWDSVIPFEPLWRELLRVCKPTAAMVFTASQPFTSALVMSQPKLFRHEWIWQKDRGTNHLSTGREPMREHESVLVFSHGKWTYNKQMQERSANGRKLIGRQVLHGGVSDGNWGAYAEVRGELSALRVPSSIQKFTKERGHHPTQKPVPLFEYLIRTYSNEGDIILDPTCGSGTTGVAAVKTGRRFVCIERDENYFNVARGRLAELQPQGGIRLMGHLF